MNKLSLIVFTTLLLLLLSAAYRHVSATTCINWQNHCYDCSCSTPGCNGDRLCYGQDDVTQQSCNISESCNLPSQKAIRSCDCASGLYENGAFQIEGVGACNAPIQCIGDTGIAKNGLSGPTCHYCATAVSPTGIPPTLLPSPTIIYRSTSNSVTLPGKQNESTPTAAASQIITSSIIDAALQITPLLSKGIDGLYNVKADESGVYYWCTYIVIDSYGDAGFKGMDRGAEGSVFNMKGFFASTPGYQLLPPSTPVESLVPGATIIFEGSEEEHVALVKNVDLDSNGNGVIHTLESNNVVTSDVVTVRNHIATRAQTTTNLYAITGFGEPTN